MNDIPAPPATAAVPIFWQVMQVAHHLQTRLEADLAGVGLSMAKAGLLKVLASAEEPMVLSDLAEHIHCVRSNVTQLVDRLEHDGLVERLHDPADGRMVRARLTDAGRRAFQQAQAIFIKHSDAVSAALGDTDAATVSEALGKLGDSCAQC